MSASLSPRLEVVILPSLPPSPSLLEEVFNHPRPWSVCYEEFDLRGLRRSSSPGGHAKGKAKQILEEEEDEDDEDTQHGVSTHEAYPPITDEVAETRRVEETLKRWELAERQRRKSVRESAQRTSGPSLLSSVTRTTSLVLSRRAGSIGASVDPEGTRTFKSHESVDVAREGYAIPLDDIDRTRSSGDVVVHSPSPSIFDRSTSLDAGAGTASGSSENPFVHPSERTLTPVTPTPTLPPSALPSPSPFADPHAQQALQANPTTRLSVESKTHARKRPSRSGVSFVPPPEAIQQVKPLQPTSQPVLRPPPPREDPEERAVRWWHDWLCGCGEGPDRGGDNQAGRTNPFE